MGGKTFNDFLKNGYLLFLLRENSHISPKMSSFLLTILHYILFFFFLVPQIWNVSRCTREMPWSKTIYVSEDKAFSFFFSSLDSGTLFPTNLLSRLFTSAHITDIHFSPVNFLPCFPISPYKHLKTGWFGMLYYHPGDLWKNVQHWTKSFHMQTKIFHLFLPFQ